MLETAGMGRVRVRWKECQKANGLSEGSRIMPVCSSHSLRMGGMYFFVLWLGVFLWPVRYWQSSYEQRLEIYLCKSFPWWLQTEWILQKLTWLQPKAQSQVQPTFLSLKQLCPTEPNLAQPNYCQPEDLWVLESMVAVSQGIWKVVCYAAL